MARKYSHISVMVHEIVESISPRESGLYVDATFGGGGWSVALLEAANCHVIGVDRDRQAIKGGMSLVEHYNGRLTLLQGRFGNLKELLFSHGITKVNGVALDLGVSSMQLDRAERGFSFRQDGPLDMRMGNEGITAADLINNSSEKELATLIRSLGEERRAARIARAIVDARQSKPLTTTGELSSIITNLLGFPRGRIHPATRTFQALRMTINEELEELRKGLVMAEKVLTPGARLAAVSFHSLEDRLVKRFFTDRSGKTPRNSRHQPDVPSGHAATFHFPTRMQRPSGDEVMRNPRARSARLRTALRTDACPWPKEVAA